MLGRYGKDAGSLLGVEIAADSVRMLQLQRRHGRRKVAAWAREPLHSPLCDDWSRNAQPVIAALRSAYARSGSTCRQVAVALPGTQVICKVCRLPAGLTTDQIEAQLLSDAQRLFPFPLEDLAMDFQVLGPSLAPGCQVDVLVAACRQRSVELLEQLFEEAGLQTVALEVDSIALRRVLPAGQRLLRVESGAASLHTWTGQGLPQRHDLQFAPVDSAEQRVERVARLLDDTVDPEQGVLVAVASETAAGWIEGLTQRLTVPCEALAPWPGVAAGGQGMPEGCAAMALACGLAMGEG
ncbi:type IV pilus assembly protein PilM [Pseudomonas hunanensis]|uniref:Type IV pilus assembly protein PilM n=1 Tax=Pseudomonas hunanensis TaxID=1247546 RepID=A0ACC6K273_9PSED|nr:pilus assembly protein PilM [Pseudomonas hunanensis]MDR6712554.1 type IV pilus assembly protein PilM [Pseudomonas hunanensis]